MPNRGCATLVPLEDRLDGIECIPSALNPEEERVFFSFLFTKCHINVLEEI